MFQELYEAVTDGVSEAKKSSEAKKAFKPLGVNPLSPVIIGYYDTGDYYVEVSSDRNEKSFGVTVLSKDGKREYDKSKLFFNKKDALDYVDSL